MRARSIGLATCALGAALGFGCKAGDSDGASGGTTSAPAGGGSAGTTSSGGAPTSNGGMSTGGSPGATTGSTSAAGGAPNGGSPPSGGNPSATGGGGDATAGGASGGATAIAGGSGGSTAGAGGGPVTKACDATQAPVIGGLGLKPVITDPGLSGVSQAVQPPNSDDWYLIEQGGIIRVFSKGSLLPAPFYDVSGEIDIDPMYDERGLHSIAFAPDYETSGTFYIVVTPTTGARANRDLLLEHKRSTADAFKADMTPVRALYDLEGRSPNDLFANIHNSYHAAFGPDGMLYVGMGDGGGSCNDNLGFVGSPQDITKPYGKMLRLDPKQPAPHGAADNPFVGDGDGRVFHIGLRNPFRFTWDSGTGDLYIGDVGQDTHEEIDVAPKGSKALNFGWAAEEGEEGTCSGKALREGATVTKPIFFTTHGGGSGIRVVCKTSPFCDYGAIVGGPVYRGAALPQYDGVYFFGDWSADNLAALTRCGDAVSPVTVIDIVADPNQPKNGFLVPLDGMPDVESLTSIVEDHDHEMYLVVNGNTLAQVVPAP
jgi:glucose/arabinose dehydrogenase